MSNSINVRIGSQETLRTSIGTVKVELASLDQLTDVEILDPIDGDVLVYDAMNGKWVAGPSPVDDVIDGGTF